MRWLLENLCPENPQIYWNWIGGVFALYVVMMTAATGVFVAHQSAKSVTGEAAMATAVRGKQRSIVAAPAQLAYRQ
jgi:divalent metal cation (Fe/Co/Zn/Cd) transporter